MRSGSKDDYGIFCLFPSSDMEIYSAKREHHEPFTRLNNSANFINYHWVFTKISRSSLMSRFMCRFVLEKMLMEIEEQAHPCGYWWRSKRWDRWEPQIDRPLSMFNRHVFPPFFREHISTIFQGTSPCFHQFSWLILLQDDPTCYKLVCKAREYARDIYHK